jgi:hypothetical protein
MGGGLLGGSAVKLHQGLHLLAKGLGRSCHALLMQQQDRLAEAGAGAANVACQQLGCGQVAV